MSLTKFADPLTLKQGQDEVQELMTEHITNTDRMNAFLFLLQDHHEHMKIAQRRELLKAYGSAAEIFEEALLPFLPKITAYLEKKLKDGDSQLHTVISDSLGQCVHYLLGKTDSIEEILNHFNPILRMIFTNLALPSKNMQQGAAQCLTKVIQNAPI